MNDQVLPALLPINFFDLRSSIPYARKFSKLALLPDTSFLLGEERFADLSVGWNEEELLIEVVAHKPFEECSLSDAAHADTIELFIDTRDVKDIGYATRFCHHFLILPKEVEGIAAQEITHFRTEDVHPLCEATQISVKSQFGSKLYTTQVTLPASCLHGYDPREVGRLGFTYRCNRYRGAPQHFSLSSQEYTLMHHPGRWASLHLNMEQKK